MSRGKYPSPEEARKKLVVLIASPRDRAIAGGALSTKVTADTAEPIKALNARHE
jgi:hypothetical protein